EVPPRAAARRAPAGQAKRAPQAGRSAAATAGGCQAPYSLFFAALDSPPRTSAARPVPPLDGLAQVSRRSSLRRPPQDKRKDSVAGVSDQSDEEWRSELILGTTGSAGQDLEWMEPAAPRGPPEEPPQGGEAGVFDEGAACTLALRALGHLAAGALLSTRARAVVWHGLLARPAWGPLPAAALPPGARPVGAGLWRALLGSRFFDGATTGLAAPVLYQCAAASSGRACPARCCAAVRGPCVSTTAVAAAATTAPPTHGWCSDNDGHAANRDERYCGDDIGPDCADSTVHAAVLEVAGYAIVGAAARDVTARGAANLCGAETLVNRDVKLSEPATVQALSSRWRLRDERGTDRALLIECDAVSLARARTQLRRTQAFSAAVVAMESTTTLRRFPAGGDASATDRRAAAASHADRRPSVRAPRPDGPGGYGYVHVRLHWKDIACNAGVACTSAGGDGARSRLNLAILSVALLTFVAIYFSGSAAMSRSR
ncbi:unnamed protein product, partial [Prorocentrum cordatum]